MAVVQWGTSFDALTGVPVEASTQLHWRPLVRTDLLELFGLLTAIELHDDPSERHSRDSLYEHFDAPESAAGENAIVGWAGVTPVAYGWNCIGSYDTDPRRVWLAGGVHPGWRRLGLGRTVMEWQLDRARRWHAETRRHGHGPLQLIGHVDQPQADRSQLFTRFGFAPVRWYADMSRPLDPDLSPDLTPDLTADLTTDALPSVELADGLELVRWTPERSESVRQAHNAAFADHWGSQPVAAQVWQTDAGRSSFRPEWSWLVLDRSDRCDGAAEPVVAGYAMSSAYRQDWDATGIKEGWTDRLGVRPEYRGRGIAKALLARTMRTFRTAGLEAAGLGVDADNPTGAFELYRAMGYTAGDTVVRYSRDDG